MTVRISGADRDALHHAITADLQLLPALAEAIKADNFTTARQLGHRYAAEFRLLDDLGWEPNDPRNHYELTLPEPLLARVMLRLRESTTLARMAVELRDSDAADFDRRILSVCTAVLGDLAPAIVRAADESPFEAW